MIKPTTTGAAALAACALFAAAAAAEPPPVIVYGPGNGTLGHKFYKIDLGAATSTELRTLAADPAPLDANSPNGAAYDEQNDLLYYSVNPGNNIVNDRLFSIPVSNSFDPPVARGRLKGRVYNGAFYKGDYYYVSNRTANFWKADLDPATGNVVTNVAVCSNFRQAGSDLRFGDIAIQDGVVYGGARDGSNGNILYFTLNMTTCAYQESIQTDSRSLQMTFGTDGKLYGYNLALDSFRIINRTDGSTTDGPPYSPAANLSDVASPMPAPKVGIVKKTNDADNPTGTGPELGIGETVTWTYEVSNLGQVPLYDVTVVDDQIADDAADILCADSTDNTVPALDVGESVTCTATGVAVAGQYVNVGTASGTFDGETVDDTDDDRYYGSPVTVACPDGKFEWEMEQDGDLAISFDQFPAPNNNTYGANTVNWNRTHTFGDLTGSDRAGIQLKDAGGVVRLNFELDYLSAKTGTPSGYASLGPFGGDGDVVTGTLSPSDIEWDTTLAQNLNNLGYFTGGVQTVGLAVTNLLVNSPPTLDRISDFTLTPAAAAAFTSGWEFRNGYFATIKASKLAQLGFDPATWTVEPSSTGLHNSPANTCPVDPNERLTVTAVSKKDKTVKITIQNNSLTVDEILTSLRFTWPQAINGNLLEIKLDGDVLWKTTAGVGSGSTDTLGNPVGVPPLTADPNKRKIGKNSSDVLSLIFKNNVAPVTDPAYGDKAWFDSYELDLFP
jgi:hypothetical protein